MTQRKLFIAGSSGAIGRTIARLAHEQGVPAVLHERPRETAPTDPRVKRFPLDDQEQLQAALRSCTTVVQVIGTVRKRFTRGDTYETSDIGTTRQLCEAARAAGTIDHIVLLSSVGAGRPMGAYLKAKAEAERLARESGIAYTIFRPSFFIGEGHKVPLGFETFLRPSARYRPIQVEQLAGAMLAAAVQHAPLSAILEGQKLWEVVDRYGPIA